MAEENDDDEEEEEEERALKEERALEEERVLEEERAAEERAERDRTVEEGINEEIAVEEEAGDGEPEEENAKEERAVEEGATRNVDLIDELVTITLNDEAGEETLFKVKSQTAFGKIMNVYAARKGVHTTDLRFLLDGELISPCDMCVSLSIEEWDQVDVILVQCSC